ncbi:hypothetical protein C8E87_8677 [Paractinoplanes brasiliensis]|uniref:Uncharacterized protein n=1 Tax=Paractinoplanes brasiliensis TaxID=52695 RepID=A0A4R6JBQ6_9ACTN|nr:hypothetical protein C8E87_8677 [Actinoplanes brasiliensis]GID33233.1 hypothetical protein Abr02nite_82160 [Actinoplanes brasiliensis]
MDGGLAARIVRGCRFRTPAPTVGQMESVDPPDTLIAFCVTRAVAPPGQGCAGRTGFVVNGDAVRPAR